MLPASAIRKLRKSLTVAYQEDKPSSTLLDHIPMPALLKPLWARLPFTFKVASLVTVGAMAYFVGKAVHFVLKPIAAFFGVPLFSAYDMPILGPLFRFMGLDFDSQAAVHADTVDTPHASPSPLPTEPADVPTAPQLKVTATPRVVVTGLGSLAAQAESGSNPGRVSTGRGDAGGVSYGLYQFASKRGVADAYVKQSPYRQEFDGLAAGTPEFSAKWQALAKRDPKGFAADQQKYAVAMYFEPVARSVKSVGLDLRSRSAGLQEMTFGTSIQYGPGYASARLIEAVRAGKTTDMQIIQHVQSYKAARVQRDFRSSSDDIRASVSKRIQNDYNKYAALADSTYSGSSVSSATPSVAAVTPSTASPAPTKQERRAVVVPASDVKNTSTQPANDGTRSAPVSSPTQSPSVFRGQNGALFSY